MKNKLTSIAANQTEIERADGTTVFYSYATPVAVFVPGKGAFVTTEKFSRTTSKHITQAIARWGCSRREVAQSTIESMAIDSATSND